MRILLIQSIRTIMPGALGLLLLLAAACGASSAPGATAPPATAAPQQQPTATLTTVPPASPTATAAPTATAVAAATERPTLKAGVIWLDSPLDPAVGSWVASQSGFSEQLFRLSPANLSPEPWLASSVTQLDPLTWEIALRDGVRFHNGAAMDAAAVKASLERTIRLSAATADALAIDGIVVKDEQTITVTTTAPRPTLPGLLSAPATAITDAAAADAAGEGNFLDAGAFTGPYIPTEYLLEERLTSVVNDAYWGGTPPLAGIDHIAIADTNSRELALQAGDIDFAMNLSPEGAAAIAAYPGLRTQTAGIGTSVVMWWVNFERETLADPLVRQAVAHAIDRESIAGLVAPAGSGSFADYLLPEAMASCPGVAGPTFDPQRARDLLAEAGYADSDGDGIVDQDGQPLEIVIGGYPQRFQLPIMAEAAQAMLADVGIQADVRITEWSVVKEPAWDLFGWYNNVVDTGDPVLNVSKFAGLEANADSSGANNYGHWDNSPLVDIIAQAGAVSDSEQREQIACAALAVITDEIAFLPVAHAYTVYGVSDRVTGFDPHPHRLYLIDHRIGLDE